MCLNIICGNRTERLPILINELKSQGVSDYKFWAGLYLPSIKESINRSHKQVVQWAKDNELDNVIIAEDDIKFFSPNAYNYFLSQMPKEYDLYLSMIFIGDLDQNNKVEDFTGLTLYSVSKKFYDTFLSTPNDDHLDRLLKGLGDYHVCVPFICTQHNGVSGNTGKFERYDSLLENRPLFSE